MADIDGIIAGEYGKTLTLNLQDDEGAVQDIESYTTLTIKIQSPRGEKKFPLTGSTTAQNYQVSFAFTSDNLCNYAGTWLGMVVIEKTGEISKSYPFTIEVEKSL